MKRLREQTKEERLRFAKMMDELKSDGITQPDLARAAGVTDAFVSRLNNGLASLSIKTAKKIERAFPKYRAAWLLGLDDRPVSNPVSKVDALKVLDPMASALSPQRRDAVLEHVQYFVEFELRKERGQECGF